MPDGNGHNGVDLPPRLRMFGADEGGESALGAVLKVDDRPLQPPRGDDLALVHEEVVGGPETRRDQRLYLDKHTLKRWLACAEQSLTGRVQLDMVGIRARLWRAPGGHLFSTLDLVSCAPKPEPTTFDTTLAGRR